MATATNITHYNPGFIAMQLTRELMTDAAAGLAVFAAAVY